MSIRLKLKNTPERKSGDPSLTCLFPFENWIRLNLVDLNVFLIPYPSNLLINKM